MKYETLSVEIEGDVSLVTRDPNGNIVAKEPITADVVAMAVRDLINDALKLWLDSHAEETDIQEEE